MNFDKFLLFLGGAIELLTNLFGIPLSLINLCLVTRTAVIHPNMKAILIFQSFFILMRGFCRFIICLFKFILMDPIEAESTKFFPPLSTINSIGIYSRNYVPHILIIERVLSTLFVRSYEHHRGLLFTLLWAPIALTISIYIAFTSNAKNVQQPLTNLITTGVQLVVGTVELAIFYKLCQYNCKIYRRMLQNDDSHSLSIRYQLSENIRIGKQLVPPLSLNLGNILAGTMILLCGYFELPFFYLVFTLGAFLNSFFGLLIELFIMTCHPFLKRDFFLILHRFGTMIGFNNSIHNNRRIGDETTITAVGMTKDYSPAGIAQRDLINGKSLLDHTTQEDHFAMLAQSWERAEKTFICPYVLVHIL